MNDLIEIGDRFGRLTVLELVEKKKNCDVWLCQCDCGEKKLVASYSLSSKHTRSCGCLLKERSSAHKIKHSLSKTSLYDCWTAIKQRCLNPKSPYFNNYGGRGIKICDEWLCFKSFSKWAFENGYSEKLTIDRIDVNGNYEPSNCRWVDRKTQARNRRDSRLLEIDGITKSISEWCEIYSVNYNTVNNRIWRGWDWKEALMAPYGVRRKQYKKETRYCISQDTNC